MAHVNGKPILIDGALPGEQVVFKYSRIRRDYGEGNVIEVRAPSADRVQPKCRYFGVCGGCSLQHLDPGRQISVKQEFLESQLRRIGNIQSVVFWEPLTGASWGYRNKARLSAKFVAKKHRALVGFREKRSNLIADIDRCEILHPKIGDLLNDLGELVTSLSIRSFLPQIEIAVGGDHCALVFRILEGITEQDRQKLIEFEARNRLIVFLQRGGPDSIEPLDGKTPVPLSYTLPQFDLTLDFEPTDFMQINGGVNRLMVAKALQVLDPQPTDTILDLFCGLGNFSLPLARSGGAIVGVEGDKNLIERAKQNARRNGVENVKFFAVDLTGDISTEPWFRRRYNKLLIDPPRIGAEQILIHIPEWKTEKIIYISCNPATLARDAGVLVNELGYRITRAGVIDMFPHTSHVESIAYFEKDTLQ